MPDSPRIKRENSRKTSDARFPCPALAFYDRYADYTPECERLSRKVFVRLFRTARTVLELGSELISSDIIAFYELVKNCFYAKKKTGVDTGADKGVRSMGIVAWNCAIPDEPFKRDFINKTGVALLIKDIKTGETTGLEAVVRSGLVAQPVDLRQTRLN